MRIVKQNHIDSIEHKDIRTVAMLEETMSNDSHADVVVVGAGIGGLVTAIEAAEHSSDLDITLLEKGTRAGGTSQLSGGTFYCYETVEDLYERDPKGDRELQELAVKNHAEAWQWLEDHGVPMEESTDVFEGVLSENEEIVRQKSVAMSTDMDELVSALVSSFEESGGKLLLETPMDKLLTDNEGAINGVRVCEIDGDCWTIQTDTVVLATGGYVANEQLVEENFFTENSEDIWLRASKWCTGDGILAAEEVGAKRSRGHNEFYGKSMIAPPAEFGPFDYSEATAYYGPFALALNQRGQRFADESESIHEKSVIQSAAKNGYSRIYYLLDDELANSTIRPHKDANIMDMLEYQKEAGGRVAKADSLQELAEIISEWGVDGKSAIETISSYNEAVQLGEAERLDPPRKDSQLVFDTPPFYIAELQPSITLTMGGLDVDTHMRVLRRATSSSTFDHAGTDQEATFQDPIEGLYAVGADVGNVGAITTMEGVSPMTANTVFGCIAGEGVAERVHSTTASN